MGSLFAEAKVGQPQSPVFRKEDVCRFDVPVHVPSLIESLIGLEDLQEHS